MFIKNPLNLRDKIGLLFSKSVMFLCIICISTYIRVHQEGILMIEFTEFTFL